MYPLRSESTPLSTFENQFFQPSTLKKKLMNGKPRKQGSNEKKQKTGKQQTGLNEERKKRVLTGKKYPGVDAMLKRKMDEERLAALNVAVAALHVAADEAAGEAAEQEVEAAGEAAEQEANVIIPEEFIERHKCTEDEGAEKDMILTLFTQGCCASSNVDSVVERLKIHVKQDEEGTYMEDAQQAVIERKCRVDFIIKEFNSIDASRNFDTGFVVIHSTSSLRRFLTEIQDGANKNEKTGLSNIFVLRVGNAFIVVFSLKKHSTQVSKGGEKFALQSILASGNHTSAVMWMCIPKGVWRSEVDFTNDDVFDPLEDASHNTSATYMNIASQVGMNTIRFCQKTAKRLATEHGVRVHMHIKDFGPEHLHMNLDNFLAGFEPVSIAPATGNNVSPDVPDAHDAPDARDAGDAGDAPDAPDAPTDLLVGLPVFREGTDLSECMLDVPTVQTMAPVFPIPERNTPEHSVNEHNPAPGAGWCESNELPLQANLCIGFDETRSGSASPATDMLFDSF